MYRGELNCQELEADSHRTQTIVNPGGYPVITNPKSAARPAAVLSNTPRAQAVTLIPVIRCCDLCSRPYEARRSTSRFCSSSCRARNGKRVRGRARSAGSGGLLADAVQAELAAAGTAETWLGRLATQLARSLDEEAHSGAGRAALSRALSESMTAALSSEGVPVEPDALDELRARRARQQGTG